MREGSVKNDIHEGGLARWEDQSLKGQFTHIFIFGIESLNLANTSLHYFQYAIFYSEKANILHITW